MSHVPVAMHFKKLSVEKAGETRCFALGTVNLHPDTMIGRKPERLPLLVFIHPQSKDLVFRESIKRLLAPDLAYADSSVSFKMGGKRHLYSAPMTTLNYRIIDDEGNQSDYLDGDVCFSDKFVEKLVKHYTERRGRSRAFEAAELAQGVIGLEHLQRHGLLRPAPLGQTVVIVHKH